MRRAVYGMALLSLLAAVGGCRRAATVVKEDRRESVRAFSKVMCRDSLRSTLDVSLDSPVIVVEYLDSPRRVVTATGRRAEARQTVAHGKDEKSETATVAISDLKIQQREESPAGVSRRWWLLVAVLIAYLAGRYRRHTS